MLHFIFLLTTTCALVFPPSVIASNMKAFGNEADDDGNIVWGSLPRRKEGEFITDRGGVLIGLYAMTNAIIYAVHPSDIDYGRSMLCSSCVVSRCIRDNSNWLQLAKRLLGTSCFWVTTNNTTYRFVNNCVSNTCTDASFR